MDLPLSDIIRMQIRAVALDLDGVVYAGDRLLDRAAETVALLRSLGLATYFVTNNSGRTRADIAAKLTRLGVAAAEQEVLTSGYAAARFVARYVGASVFVLGSDGLRLEIAATGARIVTDVKEPADFLVVGFDQEFNYTKIVAAMEVIAGGAKFIACNRDAQFPGGGGRNLPGCAAMVGAIEAVVQRRPHRLVGKPGTFLLRVIARRHGLRPENILVVGDSLDSDVAMASRFGSPSLYLGPEVGAEHVTGHRRRRRLLKSDYSLDSLANLFEVLQSDAAISRRAVAILGSTVRSTPAL